MSGMILQFLDELGHDLVRVAHQTKIGNVEDGRVWVAIDGHNCAGVFHARQMLYGAGDTYCDVEFRRYDFSRLADLQLVGRNTCVDKRARAADRAAKRIRQFADEPLEVFAVLERSTARDDDSRFGDI